LALHRNNRQVIVYTTESSNKTVTARQKFSRQKIRSLLIRRSVKLVQLVEQQIYGIVFVARHSDVCTRDIYDEHEFITRGVCLLYFYK
jgi:hypothetical protein